MHLSLSSSGRIQGAFFRFLCFGMMNNASVRESDVIQRLEKVERKVDDSIKCMFDLVGLYLDTNGLEPGETTVQPTLSDATDGRFVGSANVARS